MAFASYVTRAAVAGLLASGAGGYLLVGGLPPSLGDLAGRAEPAVDDAARAGSQAAGAARQGAEAAVDARDRAQGAGRAGIDQAQAGVDAGQSAGESLLGAIVHWSLVVLAVVAVLSVVMACTRLWARSRRRPLRYEIRVPRADRPDFARLERVIQGLHRTLQAEKGITRVLFGQDHVALEMHLVPQEGDEHRHVGNLARAFIVCPPSLVEGFDGALSDAYPHARLGYDFQGPPEPTQDVIWWTRSMVRLYKRRAGVYRSVVNPRGEKPTTLIESAITAANGESCFVGVQMRLSPTSRFQEWFMRTRVRLRERDMAHLDMVTRHEVTNSTALTDSALFRGEIWVMGENARITRHVAGLLQSGDGVNPLDRRRAWSPLHRRRVTWGLPGFTAGSIYGAGEIAGIWSVPTLESGVPAVRSGIPRLEAPPQVAHTTDPRKAIARITHDCLTIRPKEAPLGVGVIGMPGTGKTSLLVPMIGQLVNDRSRSAIILDPKDDLANKALSLVPRDRAVWVLDLANPEFGINPLMVRGTDDAVNDLLVEALRDINEDGAVQNSSDRLLRFAATGERLIAEHEDRRPNIHRVLRLLSAASRDRFRLVADLAAAKDLTATVEYFARDLPQDLHDSASMTATRLQAPRNKLERLVQVTSLDRALHHPVQLALDEVIARREVLIVKGAMGSIGTDNSAKMLQILVRVLFAALQRQQEMRETDRVPVALFVDEAHFVLNRAFAKMAAVARSAGLEVVCAWQHGAQFEDIGVRGAIDDLLAHRFIFRAGVEDARASVALLQSVYEDSIRDSPRLRDMQRVMPDTILNLPQHYGIASMVVNNQRTTPFVIHTLPAVEDAMMVAYHHAAQRRRPLDGQFPDADMPLDRLDDGEAIGVDQDDTAFDQDDLGIGSIPPVPAEDPEPAEEPGEAEPERTEPAEDEAAEPGQGADEDEVDVVGTVPAREATDSTTTATPIEVDDGDLVAIDEPDLAATVDGEEVIELAEFEEITENPEGTDTPDDGPGVVDEPAEVMGPGQEQSTGRVDQADADGDGQAVAPDEALGQADDTGAGEVEVPVQADVEEDLEPVGAVADGKARQDGPGAHREFYAHGDDGAYQQPPRFIDPSPTGPPSKHTGPVVGRWIDPDSNARREARAAEREAQTEKAARDAAAARENRATTTTDSFLELEQLDELVALEVQEQITKPTDKQPRVKPDHVALAQLLYRANYLASFQIARYQGWNTRKVASILGAMRSMGWVRRFDGVFPDSRKAIHLWQLTQTGYTQAFAMHNKGRDVQPDREWATETPSHPATVVHDARAAAWVMKASGVLTPGVVRAWYGPRTREAQPTVPHVKQGYGAKRPATREDIPVTTGRLMLPTDEFRTIRADAMLDLMLDPFDAKVPQERKRVRFAIEYNHARRPSHNEGKFAQYDAFISGWSWLIPAYGNRPDGPGRAISPGVVFIAGDEPALEGMMRVADQVMTGVIARPRVPKEELSYRARRSAFFVLERDIHEDNLRAYQLHPLPPDVRGQAPGEGVVERPLVRPELITWSGHQQGRG